MNYNHYFLKTTDPCEIRKLRGSHDFIGPPKIDQKILKNVVMLLKSCSVLLYFVKRQKHSFTRFAEGIFALQHVTMGLLVLRKGRVLCNPNSVCCNCCNCIVLLSSKGFVKNGLQYFLHCLFERGKSKIQLNKHSTRNSLKTGFCQHTTINDTSVSKIMGAV